jgi:DNA polymerase III subunit alpha
MSYAQLNTETAYDFGSSTILPADYALRAKSLGYAGIGISDNHLFAFPSFAEALEGQELKGLFGYHVPLASIGTVSFDGTLFVLSEKGYRNLCEILSTDITVLGTDILNTYHEGLALVLDAGSNDDFRQKTALDAFAPQILNFSKIFGKDFYIGIAIYSEVDKNEMPELYQFCSDNGYQTIAFPKALYLRKSDAKKTILLNKALKGEKADALPDSGPFFLLSEKVLQTLYRQPDIDATSELLAKADFTFFAKRGQLISFGSDDDGQLSTLSMKGLLAKTNGNPQPAYLNRLSYELSVIQSMAFSSYFLLVSDYVTYAKANGIKVGPGRGSACGSLVAYVLGITDLDPLRYNLSFERFLNPKRKNMPDIDIDFDSQRRNEVVDYLRHRYGENYVADIITFSTLKPKSALKLIGPALSFNESRLSAITSAISDKAENFAMAREDYFLGDRFSTLYADPYYHNLCDMAEGLLGIPVNTSIHAAGIILSQNEIHKTCPMSLKTKGTVQYEYPAMERMGFLKVDILALSNLTFLKEIEEKLTAEKKPLPDIQSSLEDKAVYDVLNSLELSDIFQLNSEGMKKTIKAIHPTQFSDIPALISLYRPGPKKYISLYSDRKHGKAPVTYRTPILEPILKDTYGIMIYQEQVIEAVKAVASFSASDADLFRRAISKKDLSKMEKYKDQFLKGAQANGLSAAVSEGLYQDIEEFANYGFNKSHAYAYAIIAYTLLYYKANYPEEFYSVAFNDTSLNSEDASKLIQEIEANGFTLQAPSLNDSMSNGITVQAKNVFLPLSAVSSLPKTAAEKILAERTEHGPFLSFYDFAKRLSGRLTLTEEKGLPALIDAGGFDSFFPIRTVLRDHLSEYLSFARMSFKDSSIPPLKDEGGEDLGERLFREKRALGIIASQKLDSIVHKDGYMTLLVTDDAEIGRRIVAESATQSYTLLTADATLTKNSFLLVKFSDPTYIRGYQTPDDLINEKTRRLA